MREAVRDISPFDLEDKDVDWVVRRIRERLTEQNFRLDFFEWADSFLATKKDGSRKSYITAINTFERFLGKRHIDINDITKSLLLDFVDYVDAEPKMWKNCDTGEWVELKMKKNQNGATFRHISRLQHIFNAAKDRYNDEDFDRM